MLLQRRNPYTEPTEITNAINCENCISTAEIQQQIYEARFTLSLTRIISQKYFDKFLKRYCALDNLYQLVYDKR